MRTLTSLAALSLVATLIGCDNPKRPAAPVEGAASAPASAPAAATAPQAQAETAPDPRILGVGKTPEDIAPGASNLYGAHFTLMDAPIPLATAIEQAATSPGPYKVEANVQKVCQVKGCWFTLQSEGVSIPIRVSMKDYKFFVPKNAEGSPAVLEGTLERTTIEQDVAQHYADDEAKATGKPAPKIEGPQDTYQFVATAVQITKADGT